MKHCLANMQTVDFEYNSVHIQRDKRRWINDENKCPVGKAVYSLKL